MKLIKSFPHQEIFIAGANYGKTVLMEAMAKDWLLKNPNGKVIKIGYKDCNAADNGMKNFIKYFRDLDMEDL